MRALFLILIMFSASLAYGADRLEQEFLWNQANSEMAEASTGEDFLAAAETYTKLANTGVKNGALFYNLGTALLHAEQYEQAEEYLLRAERYRGTTWEVQRNLSLASAAGDNDQVLQLAWYRYPLAWHFRTTINERVDIAVVIFSALWFILALRVMRVRYMNNLMLALCILAIILIGSSLFTSIQSERNAEIPSIESLTIDSEAPVTEGVQDE